jgi:hypothetical protein
MKQQRSWRPFLSHKLLAVLIFMVILAVMLIGFLTGGNNTVVFFLPRLFSLAMHCFSITIVLGSLPLFIVSYRSIKHIHIPVALIRFKKKTIQLLSIHCLISEIRVMQTMIKAAIFF